MYMGSAVPRRATGDAQTAKLGDDEWSTSVVRGCLEGETLESAKYDGRLRRATDFLKTRQPQEELVWEFGTYTIGKSTFVKTRFWALRWRQQMSDIMLTSRRLVNYLLVWLCRFSKRRIPSSVIREMCTSHF